MTSKKKKAAHGDLNQDVLFDGRNKKKDNTPARISEAQLAEILMRMSPNANQDRRFVQTLARSPLATTKQCCINIGCVNLSHLRTQTAKVLSKFGLEAKCVHPDKPITNGFGEDTGQQLWALYWINKAVKS